MQSIEDLLDEDSLRWRQERRRRLGLIAIIVPALTGLLLSEISPIFVRNETQSVMVLIGKYTLYAMSGFGVLMIYLQTGFKSTAPQSTFIAKGNTEIESLRERLETTRSETERLKQLVSQLIETKDQLTKAGTSIEELTDEQRAEIAELIKRQIETEASSEAFKALRDQMLQTLGRDSRLEQLSNIFKATITRLNQEIAALGWRGNLNLVIGIFISVSGLSVLGYVVFYSQLTGSTPEALAVYYLPRISLVLFVEVFAYFFLKLYKSSLAEIKYFQNEITNIESKLAALLEATRDGSDNVRPDVIRGLAVTERNYILKKDETTVDIERAKLEKDAMSDLGDKVLQAFRIRDK